MLCVSAVTVFQTFFIAETRRSQKIRHSKRLSPVGM
jgi:hypothetical protein